MRQEVSRWFVIACFSVLLAVFLSLHFAQADVTITATVNGACGNGTLESGEQCDGTDLGGLSCSSFNFSSGILSCTQLCTFNISQCVAYVPPPPGGGGGGGGGGGVVVTPNGNATAVFTGQAFPGSSVSLLRDGVVVASSVAGPDANFQISSSNLTLGMYSFSLIAEDADGLTSQTQSFSLSLTSGISAGVSGVFFSPTLRADKSQVKLGDTISFLGHTFPAATVSLLVHSNSAVTASAIANKQGSYFYSLDTTLFEKGSHQVTSKSTNNNQVSPASAPLAFIVGDKTVLATLPAKNNGGFNIADLNKDGKVNIVDFSILAYWYHKTKFPVNMDLNKDGKVDIVDFSIMAYNWTG